MSQNALDFLECLQIMEELGSVTTIEELSSAIDFLSNGKGPGVDNIALDFIKTCKSVLLLPLHEILCQCWQKGEAPHVIPK